MISRLSHLVPMLTEKKTVSFETKADKKEKISEITPKLLSILKDMKKKSGFAHLGLVDPGKCVVPTIIGSGLVIGIYEALKMIGR